MKHLKFKALIALSFLLYPQVFHAQGAQERLWGNEIDAFAKDPETHYEKLPNGLKYAWNQTGKKKGECQLRLVVHVGSLHEANDELGMAHVLEHMAFAGSQNFPKRALIHWFQENGIEFGPHANAYTTFDHTVYQIDLSRCTAQRVIEGLRVFRDFADGLLLEEPEVVKELDIVQMEEQDRNSGIFRVVKRTFEEYYKGLRHGLRLPIGKKEVRKTFNRERISKFYNKWYRPDNMSLVLVGDFGGGVDQPVQAIFASLQARGDDVPALGADTGRISDESRNVVISEPKIKTVDVSFEAMRYSERVPNNLVVWEERYRKAIAVSMYRQRFVEELNQQNRSYHLGLKDGMEPGLPVELTGLGVAINNISQEQWISDLNHALLTHFKIMTCGFADRDFFDFSKNYKRSLDNFVRDEMPENILSDLLGDAVSTDVRLSPQYATAHRHRMFANLDAAQLTFILKENWNADRLLRNILVSSDFKGIPSDEVLAIVKGAFHQARVAPVQCDDARDAAHFAYETEPLTQAPNYVRSVNHGFGYTTVAFANGVRAHIKPFVDTSAPKKIFVDLALGNGAAEFKEPNRLVKELAQATWTAGGVGAHTGTEMQRMHAGTEIEFGSRMELGSSLIKGSTVQSDLLRYLEWNRAYMIDPAFRESIVAKAKEDITNDLMHDQTTFAGAAKRWDYDIFGRDPRFAPYNQADVAAISAQQIRTWMEERFLRRCPEITIVGDVDIEQAILDLGQTMGTILDCDPSWLRGSSVPTVSFPQGGVHRTEVLESKDSQVIIEFNWPIAERIAPKDSPLQSVIGNLVLNRATDLLRIKLGIAYTPDASIDSFSYPYRVGWLKVLVSTDPSHAEQAKTAVIDMMKSFDAQPVTLAELAKARNPLLEQMASKIGTSQFWLSLIPFPSDSPYRSADEIIERIATIRPAEIQAVMQTWFAADRFSSLTVYPEDSERVAAPVCE